MAAGDDGGAAPRPGPADGRSSRGSPGWPTARGAVAAVDGATRTSSTGNVQAFLRALYLQLALGARPARRAAPTCCWSLVDALRAHQPASDARPLTDAAEPHDRRVSLRDTTDQPTSSGHAGELAVAVARAHGVETMFTLSGAHVFPMYDGAVKADPPMRLLDVRHEQTAAFAAEATGKLTRVPGPRRADRRPRRHQRRQRRSRRPSSRARRWSWSAAARPQNRWGSGSLQELDQPPIVAPVAEARRAPSTTADDVARRACDEAFTAGRLRRTAARCSSTSRWTSSSTPRRGARPPSAAPRGAEPDPDALGEIAELLGRRDRPGAGPRHRRVGRRRRGGRAAAGRGRRPARRSPTAWAAASSRAATRCWSPRPAARRSAAPTWSSWSARPLDFRLGYGVFGGKDGARRRRSCTSPTPPARSSGHAELAALGVSGDLTAVLDGLLRRARAAAYASPTGRPGSADLQDTVKAARRARRRAARAPRPTRSTRPASTASWCRGWPTTPW